MNGTPFLAFEGFVLLFCLLAMLPLKAAATSPDALPVITSISAEGTNLIFTASFPDGATQAVLEFRPALSDAWQKAATLDVSTNGGTVEFSIPQPALETAFFRLNVILSTISETEVSSEVHYQAAPPMPEIYTNGSTEAVFHFKGQIDGSDHVTITHSGAFWEHVNWDWPGAVSVNGLQWNPSEKNFLTTTGAVQFLSDNYSLAAADLEVIEGRDVVALERTNNALIVCLDDTPPGSAPYDFKIHFHRRVPKPARTPGSTAASLKITAQIDGSDRLKITSKEATWTHLAYSPPGAVTINGVPWDVGQTNLLSNSGTNVFLPFGIDFSTAKIIGRHGRDLATMWADKNAIWVTFADNPNGGDEYELEIAFGK